jgi:hypothetical protein
VVRDLVAVEFGEFADAAIQGARVLCRLGLPDAPEAYGAMITRAKAAPPQSRYADLS